MKTIYRFPCFVKMIRVGGMAEQIIHALFRGGAPQLASREFLRRRAEADTCPPYLMTVSWYAIGKKRRNVLHLDGCDQLSMMNRVRFQE